MANLGNPNQQEYVFLDQATGQPSAPQTVGDLVQVANYVWDTGTLDWVKAVGSSGVGSDVTVTNFPASQAVTGPLTDAELRASPIVVTGGASGPPGVTPVQFGLSSTVVGQQAMALSIPVVIASNQGALPVTIGGGGSPGSTFVAGTVTVLGTVGAQQGGTWSFGLTPPMPITSVQFGLSSTVMGQSTMSKSVPVALASDQSPISLVGGGSSVILGTVSVLAVPGTNIIGSVNVGGSVSLLGIPTVQGPTADSLPITGNPVAGGGRVAINNNPGNDDGDITFQQLDRQGRAVVAHFTVRGLSAQGTCLLQGTVETQFIAAAGSTIFQDLTGLIIANGNSTIPVRVMIRGALGSSVLQNHNILAGDTQYVEFTRPLEGPAKNMAWTAQLAQAAGSVWVSGQVVRLI